MTDPKIAGRKPVVIDLEPGTYFWCVCGESSAQPFCDGSHKGTGFRPQKFTVDEKRRVALCQCKRTGNSPFCDGTHGSLD
ncbi:MAG: CDGSH iron-sulfur domain-containing protein [Candidatus Krumholzibacteriia bacterium]